MGNYFTNGTRVRITDPKVGAGVPPDAVGTIIDEDAFDRLWAAHGLSRAPAGRRPDFQIVLVAWDHYPARDAFFSADELGEAT